MSLSLGLIDSGHYDPAMPARCFPSPLVVEDAPRVLDPHFVGDAMSTTVLWILLNGAWLFRPPARGQIPNG